MFERAVEEVARGQGYDVPPSNGGHAGRTFTLRYRGDWGPDHVKIDCIYMNRSPILPLTMQETILRPGLQVCTFSNEELAAGKVKALFDRVKIRDLYDIANLSRYFGERARNGDDLRISHQLILYYASLSACFPNDFLNRPLRFADKQRELKEQLFPMLRGAGETPELQDLLNVADEFIAAFVLPQTPDEEEYLQRFAQADYQPGLLFKDAAMVKAAEVNPEALWKLQNLKRMIQNVSK
ncbi:MAG: nucleotidyl transferase AbiEii/AbiGii toxin family protein [Coriobacteriales bacterium]|nr:nucleotidyl transferase AbiEii/AbiGii toxin family protein [Coriobacteriales bacterium]